MFLDESNGLEMVYNEFISLDHSIVSDFIQKCLYLNEKTQNVLDKAEIYHKILLSKDKNELKMFLKPYISYQIYEKLWNYLFQQT